MFDKLEEMRRLTLAELPIKIGRKHGNVKMKIANGQKKTLKQIVAEICMPPYPCNTEIKQLIHDAVKAAGKTTTDGSIEQAIYSMRRESRNNGNHPFTITKAARGSVPRVPKSDLIVGPCSCNCAGCRLHSQLIELETLKERIREISDLAK